LLLTASGVVAGLAYKCFAGLEGTKLMSQHATASICLDETDEPDDIRLDRSEIMKRLLTEPTLGPEEAGCVLGLGRSSSYRACRNKQIPNIKIGGRFIVPTAPLRRMLGLEPQLSPTPPQAETLHPVATVSAPAKAKKPARRQRRRRK
jgi:hypothetical protein